MNYENFKQGSKRRLLLTKEGLDKLRGKLDEITERRHNAFKKLRRMDKSDADKLAVSTEVRILENTEIEVAELADLLQHVEPVVKQGIPKRVTVGCTVGLKMGDTITSYTIVCPLEIDIEKNRISEDSLLGQAVMSKKVNEVFSIVTPKGTVVSYEVISIT